MAEYLAVLLDIFDNRLDEQWTCRGVGRGPGGFETLARARRYLGLAQRTQSLSRSPSPRMCSTSPHPRSS
jgi:hypothetical protein